MDTNEVTEKARQSTQEMKETAQQWAEKAKETTRDASAAADLYVHEYAWTTLMLVAVGAAVFGFLLGRRQT